MSDAPAAAFQPDTELVDDIHPSPNVNERQNGARPAMLVLHYTGLPSVTRSISPTDISRGLQRSTPTTWCARFAPRRGGRHTATCSNGASNG